MTGGQRVNYKTDIHVLLLLLLVIIIIIIILIIIIIIVIIIKIIRKMELYCDFFAVTRSHKPAHTACCC